MFGGFSGLASGLSKVTQAVTGLDALTGGAASAVIQRSPIGRTINTINRVTNIAGQVSDQIERVFPNVVQNVAREFIGGAATTNLGGIFDRFSGAADENFRQGLLPGGEPVTSPSSGAVAQAGPSFTSGAGTAANDWRVRLSVPGVIQNTTTFAPFASTHQSMVFPFNPTVLFGASANYSQVQPTHTNYPYQAYQNSQVDTISISGEFFNENEEDAQYFLACLGFLRTMTKMFYANNPFLGNPPLICRLNGYGEHVLNNIPVVVQSFTMDLGSEVDYIPCTYPADGGKINYVPTQTLLAVNLLVQYSRRTRSQFSLDTYSKGGHVGSGEGFI